MAGVISYREINGGFIATLELRINLEKVAGGYDESV